jgi:hypothetical protein
MSRAFLAATVRLTLALVLVACSAATQRAFVAPSDDTIYSETVEQQGGDIPTHVIYVLNRSTVPVTVFSVSLRSCENIEQECVPKRANHRIAPGGRVAVIRVQPDSPTRGFRYYFSFGWRADSSGAAALGALASGGDPRSQERLAAIKRADSIEKTLSGPRYHELTRDDFVAMAGKMAALRVVPDSLTMTPGEQTTMQHVRVLVLDDAGQVLGRTQWLEWMISGMEAVDFTPPDRLRARRLGRATVRFRMAEEAERIAGKAIAEIELPIVVAYRMDPNAPVFAGRVIDAQSKTPLACARVALEDSLQNVVTRSRTDATGAFEMKAPHPGSFRVRVETHGWAPVYGPTEVGAPNERKQGEYPVRFTEQMLASIYERPDADYQRARPASVTTEVITAGPSRGKVGTTPIVSGITLGGSESMPILGIIGRVQPMTTWMQFVVDSTGRVDTTSILLSPDTPANAKASVASVLPRVRFSPARELGKPICELVRMQVNFSPR